MYERRLKTVILLLWSSFGGRREMEDAERTRRMLYELAVVLCDSLDDSQARREARTLGGGIKSSSAARSSLAGLPQAPLSHVPGLESTDIRKRYNSTTLKLEAGSKASRHSSLQQAGIATVSRVSRALKHSTHLL